MDYSPNFNKWDVGKRRATVSQEWFQKWEGLGNCTFVDVINEEEISKDVIQSFQVFFSVSLFFLLPSPLICNRW
jgi:hypothetical protein